MGSYADDMEKRYPKREIRLRHFGVGNTKTSFRLKIMGKLQRVKGYSKLLIIDVLISCILCVVKLRILVYVYLPQPIRRCFSQKLVLY